MQDQACRRPLPFHRFPQSLADQFLRHSRAHGIADDLAGKHIFDACEVQPTLISRNVGDVTHPHLARLGRFELLVQQVICYRQIVVGVGRGFEFALLDAANAFFPPQSCNPVSTRLDSFFCKFILQALGAVSAARLGMCCPNSHAQALILQCATARWPFQPGVKTAARYRQNPAQQLDWILRSPLGWYR